MVSETVIEQRVVIPYTPRRIFLPYHQSPKRFTLSVAHRRAGKTVARINKLIKAAALCTRPDPRFGYLAPYFVQAKDIAWNYLKHYGSPVLHVDGPFGRSKPNESELSIRMPHNNAVIRLYGAENAERMRGLYFDGIAVDEAQDITPSALTSVILPALSDRQGWLDVSGTPKGYGNLLGKTYKNALDDMDWFVQVLRASQTGIIPQSELDLLRKMMPENEYLQEFECDFDAAITGAYYAKGLADAEFDGRITKVPYDKSVRVCTMWDLGMADSMTIWFCQIVGRELRFIDYYEASGYGLEHYAEVLDKRGYLYGKHYAPHDIMVRELGTGKSRWETADSLGIRFEEPVNIPLKDGIDAVRMAMNRCYWDREKTEQGREALKQYQEKWDEKRNVSLGPLHNWCSHPADALRIGIVHLEEPNLIKPRDHDDTRIGGAGGWMQ